MLPFLLLQILVCGLEEGGAAADLSAAFFSDFGRPFGFFHFAWVGLHKIKLPAVCNVLYVKSKLNSAK